jgi:hypothetical protein
MADKPWDMIAAEVEALAVDNLKREAWQWFRLEEFATEDHRELVIRDLRTAIAALGPGGNGSGESPFALQRLRGWCAQKREAHGGLRPDELADERRGVSRFAAGEPLDERLGGA